MKKFLNQKGLIQWIVLIILAVALPAVLYLTKHPQIFKPRAYEPAGTFTISVTHPPTTAEPYATVQASAGGISEGTLDHILIKSARSDRDGNPLPGGFSDVGNIPCSGNYCSGTVTDPYGSNDQGTWAYFMDVYYIPPAPTTIPTEIPTPSPTPTHTPTQSRATVTLNAGDTIIDVGQNVQFWGNVSGHNATIEAVELIDLSPGGGVIQTARPNCSPGYCPYGVYWRPGVNDEGVWNITAIAYYDYDGDVEAGRSGSVRVVVSDPNSTLGVQSSGEVQSAHTAAIPYCSGDPALRDNQNARYCGDRSGSDAVTFPEGGGPTATPTPQGGGTSPAVTLTGVSNVVVQRGYDYTATVTGQDLASIELWISNGIPRPEGLPALTTPARFTFPGAPVKTETCSSTNCDLQYHWVPDIPDAGKDFMMIVEVNLRDGSVCTTNPRPDLPGGYTHCSSGLPSYVYVEAIQSPLTPTSTPQGGPTGVPSVNSIRLTYPNSSETYQTTGGQVWVFPNGQIRAEITTSSNTNHIDAYYIREAGVGYVTTNEARGHVAGPAPLCGGSMGMICEVSPGSNRSWPTLCGPLDMNGTPAGAGGRLIGLPRYFFIDGKVVLDDACFINIMGWEFEHADYPIRFPKSHCKPVTCTNNQYPDHYVLPTNEVNQYGWSAWTYGSGSDEERWNQRFQQAIGAVSVASVPCSGTCSFNFNAPVPSDTIPQGKYFLIVNAHTSPHDQTEWSPSDQGCAWDRYVYSNDGGMHRTGDCDNVSTRREPGIMNPTIQHVVGNNSNAFWLSRRPTIYNPLPPGQTSYSNTINPGGGSGTPCGRPGQPSCSGSGTQCTAQGQPGCFLPCGGVGQPSCGNTSCVTGQEPGCVNPTAVTCPDGVIFTPRTPNGYTGATDTTCGYHYNPSTGQTQYVKFRGVSWRVGRDIGGGNNGGNPDCARAVSWKVEMGGQPVTDAGTYPNGCYNNPNAPFTVAEFSPTDTGRRTFKVTAYDGQDCRGNTVFTPSEQQIDIGPACANVTTPITDDTLLYPCTSNNQCATGHAVRERQGGYVSQAACRQNCLYVPPPPTSPTPTPTTPPGGSPTSVKLVNIQRPKSQVTDADCQTTLASSSQTQTRSLIGSSPFTIDNWKLDDYGANSSFGPRTVCAQFFIGSTLAGGVFKEEINYIGGIVTPTPTPGVTGCECQTGSNTCTNVCQFENNTPLTSPTSHRNPIMCWYDQASLPKFTSTPDNNNKDSYCNRRFRTQGDANKDGRINVVDYSYLRTAFTGGTIPPDVNPDFSGDGIVGLDDVNIWKQFNGTR